MLLCFVIREKVELTNRGSSIRETEGGGGTAKKDVSSLAGSPKIQVAKGTDPAWDARVSRRGCCARLPGTPHPPPPLPPPPLPPPPCSYLRWWWPRGRWPALPGGQPGWRRRLPRGTRSSCLGSGRPAGAGQRPAALRQLGLMDFSPHWMASLPSPPPAGGREGRERRW